MAGADIRRYSSDRRGMALNFFLGVGNGSLLILADTLIHPTLVLALFVAALTDDALLIGLVPAVASGVWFLPQLFSAAIVQGRRRQLPWAAGASIVRTAAIVLLALVGYRADSMTDSELLRSFFICYVAYNLAAGFANVPSTELAAKAIAAEKRGLFFSQRNLWGGILGFGGGFVIREVLGSGGPEFPRNFTFLFIAAALALAAGTFLQAVMREPVRLAAHRTGSVTRALRDGPRVLTDGNYRRYILFRVLLSLSAIADPFFIVYAQRELDAPASFVGLYVAAMTGSRIVSNVFWGALCNRHGNRAVLQFAALARLVVPVIALMLPYVTRTDLYQDRVSNERIALYAFGVVFIAYGAALSGQILSNLGYILDIAPDELRPTYIGLANTILGLVSFIPIVGGSIVDRYGYEEVFLAATFLSLGAVFLSGALTDTHARTRPTMAAWGLRRARS
ncbi:MAG: MFS transporter [Thermomicrobiales bacterium]